MLYEYMETWTLCEYMQKSKLIVHYELKDTCM